MHALAPPTGRRDRGGDVFPIDDGQCDRGPEVVGPAPGLERRRDVAPDDQEQCALGRLTAQRLDRVDRVRRALAINFEPRNLEPGHAFDRGRDHLETGLCTCADAPTLLPGITGDDDEHPGEPELVPRRRGRGEMGDVNGVEGAAEKAEALHPASVREGLVNAVLPRSHPALPRRNLAGVVSLVVRVWLPDRPGALGLVASRIGAIGGDIVGIDVLERSDHVAVDEFAVLLPDRDLVALLVREIEEVDGASVEQWREVATFPDPRLDALESVEHLSGAQTRPELIQRLVDSVRDEFAADWAALLEGDIALAASGAEVPDPSVLEALAAGVAASPVVAAGDAGPDDLAVAPFPKGDLVLLVGRDGHPFRRRERRQLLALARIADRVGTILSGDSR